MDAAQSMTVYVRDREQFSRLADVDEWDGCTMMAAVSADPRTMHELGLAWLRYAPDCPLEKRPWVAATGDPPAGDWLLIDLACQRLVTNMQEFVPDERAAYQEEDGKWRPDMRVIWVNLPPWWQHAVVADFAAVLTPLPPPVEPMDFREVLFGRTLSQSLARQLLTIAASDSMPADYLEADELSWETPPTAAERELTAEWHALTKRVHADWLMTPRLDLGGEPPRTFLHRGRAWAEWEMENRERQWSAQKQPPRGLDPQSFAYRFGPMGRNEVVIYFELCRELIRVGWKSLCACRGPHGPLPREAELERNLWEHMQSWLQESSLDGDPTPPADVIENSRRHLPQLANNTQLDCDCPLCRMMMDDESMFYPSFSCFDGHYLELDDEFAFSLCETRGEWEAQQAEYEAMEEKLDRSCDAGDSGKGAAADEEFRSVWDGYMAEGGIPGQSIMALAFRLTELIGDLQQRQATAEQIESLNASFDDLRHADEFVQRISARGVLREELECLAADWPELTGKVADLQSQLDEWLRQSAADDVPF